MKFYINGLRLYIVTNMFFKVDDKINLCGVRTGVFKVEYFCIDGRIDLTKMSDNPESNLFTFEVCEDVQTAA